MLVLTRKLGERIFIGENIVITLLDAQSTRARIGIDAPADVEILREELCRTRLPLANHSKEQLHAVGHP